MRLATVRTDRGPRLHVHGRTGYVDVADAAGDPRLSTMAGYLDGGESARSAVAGVTRQDGRPVDDAHLGPAVPDAPRILCMGVNYRAHAAEAGRDEPAWPEVFVRGAASIVGPYDDVVRPILTDGFDFEGEIGIVMSGGGRYIPAADALSAVAGVVVLNDMTARDWQGAGTQWTGGKNFDGTLPMGPELVTLDEIDVTNLDLTTRLNGDVMQSANTKELIVSVAECIEFLSSFTSLAPGDVIATGTPGGVGFARKPPVWLNPDDVIEVSVDGVGTIRNTIVRDSPPPESWRWRPTPSNDKPF